jgi:mannosidase alpha-like ER degradation enhancer 3
MLLLWTSLLIGLAFLSSQRLTNRNLVRLRKAAKDAFLHSFDSYMNFGYPYDEVLPLSCTPRKFDNRSRGTLDDVLGDYMLTLIDSLDTLIMLGEVEKFRIALTMLKPLSFVKDVNVSVFEANIRVLGGLLSAHQLALILYDSDIYDGYSLLHYATDLAERLMPAFRTKTGIPYHRVNLLTGTIKEEQMHTCTAAGFLSHFFLSIF